MAAPHHVGDQIPPWMWSLAFVPVVNAAVVVYVIDMLAGHRLFETTASREIAWVIANRTVGGRWNFVRDYSALTLNQIVRNVVDRAYSYYPFMNMMSGHVNIARSTLPNAVDATISVLKKFANEVSPNLTGVSISGIHSLSQNITASLSVIPTPTGAAITGIPEWRTSNASIVSIVSTNGRNVTIRGVSQGSATITVTVNGFTATRTITVNPPSQGGIYCNWCGAWIGFPGGWMILCSCRNHSVLTHR